ncbi:MAG: transposase, partial [Candidatus Omnitrophica bacterium]|nr:transposase [Candidatus Omnitrophota bacterium]
TKYRYKMFSKFKYKSLCEACIRKVATKHNLQIHVLSVMPEHVHILVTLPKCMNEEKGSAAPERRLSLPFLSQPS